MGPGRWTTAPGPSVRCTWIEIPQVARTHAVLLSPPVVDVGRGDGGQRARRGDRQRGRLHQRRARGRHRAAGHGPAPAGAGAGRHRGGGGRGDRRTCSRRHGQGGALQPRAPGRFTYHNSFLVADPDGAIVLETAGRRWATEEVRRPGPEHLQRSHHPRVRRGPRDTAPRRGWRPARHRRAIDPGRPPSRHRPRGPDDRSCGTTAPGRPAPVLRRSTAPWPRRACTPAGVVTTTQTTASWVADLRADADRALGHRHGGALHVAVQAGARSTSPSTWGPGPDDHRRSGHPVVAPRAPAPRARWRDPEALLPRFTARAGPRPRRPGWPTRPTTARRLRRRRRAGGPLDRGRGRRPPPDRRGRRLRRYWAGQDRAAGLSPEPAGAGR